MTPEEYASFVEPPCERCGSTSVTTGWHGIYNPDGTPHQYLPELRTCRNPACPTQGGLYDDPFA